MEPHRLHGHQKQRISTEMYLKSIYLFQTEHGTYPRSVDIGKLLGLKKGSVSEMVQKLSDEGLVTYESFGEIQLTTKGKQEALNVVRKYQIIRTFLLDVLKIDPKKVDAEACNLEHAFSDESIARLNIVTKLLGKDVH